MISEYKAIKLIIGLLFIGTLLAVGIRAYMDIKTTQEEANAIFDLLCIDNRDELTKRQKAQAHKETVEIPQMKHYVEELYKNKDRFIYGSFNWDYRNQNNKEDFLAFRAGECLYKGDFITADNLYENIHEEVVEQELVISIDFKTNKESVYVHPIEGGYCLSGVLELTFSIKGGKNRRIKIGYEAVFTHITTTETDTWDFWHPGDTDVLFVSRQFIDGSLN